MGTISDRLATTRHLPLFPKTDNLAIQVSSSTQVKCKDGFEPAAYGFLFAPHTMWALISDRLSISCHLSLFPKWMSLKYGFQGQHRSNVQVKCKDGFELAAYGFPFAPHTMWALISDRLTTARHLLLFPKIDDLEL